MRRALAAAALAWALALAGCAEERDPAPSYRVVLQAEGGELPFRMDVREVGGEGSGEYEAAIHNGEEVIIADDVDVLRRPLLITVRFPHVGSTLSLSAGGSGDELSGAWVKPRPEGKLATLLARATPGDADVRFEPHPSGVVNAEAFAGRWRIDFGEDQDPGVGVFEVAPDGEATGTVMTSTGDYRHMAGRAGPGMLRLSAFDGSHAILVRATLQDDGTLLGDTSWGNWALQTWSATRDDEASLPDAASLESITEGASIDDVRLRSLDGGSTTLRDAVNELDAEATIVLLFGSWCPNSGDATDDLVELLRRYGERGLGVLGVAYQTSDRMSVEPSRVEAYRRMHAVPWPLYIGGVTDKAEAGRTMPIISGVHAYPTLIFLDASGEPVSVLTGYNGPVSGEPHARFVGAVEARIRAMLGE